MPSEIEYLSFLIRLWRKKEDNPMFPALDWHSEVEHIQTGEHWEFVTLNQLFDFLQRRTQDSGDPPRLRRDEP
jgi:hypothetical protein